MGRPSTGADLCFGNGLFWQNSPTFAPTSSRVDSALQQGITIQLRKSQEVKLKQGIKSKVSDAEEKVKADGVVEPEVLTDEQKMAVSMSSVEVQKKLRENVGDIPTAQLWSAISRQLQQSGSPLDSTKQQADMPDSDGAVAAKGAPDSEPVSPPNRV